jgi:hypothetical protein
MTFRFVFAAATALALSTAAIAPLAHADEPSSTQGHSGMRGFLTPQQRAMLMMENRGQSEGMSQEDRHAAREKMHAQWMAMSQSDRETKRAALQAKWDALPQAKKDELNTKMQQWAQHRGQHNNSSNDSSN